MDATSETDEDDRTLLCDEGGLADGGAGGRGRGEDEEAGSPAGVPSPEASPRVGHALLSHRDQEEAASQEEAQGWRLEEDGHLGESRVSGLSVHVVIFMSKPFLFQPL